MRHIDPATMRTSTYSGVQNDCVEVGGSGGDVGVRDTKRRGMGLVVVSGVAWRAFTRSQR